MHLRNLVTILQRLEEYDLRVWKDKYAFFKPCVECLGHIVSSKGLPQAPPNVNAIVEAPSKKNLSQFRLFLGMLK